MAAAASCYNQKLRLENSKAKVHRDGESQGTHMFPGLCLLGKDAFPKEGLDVGVLER